MINKLFLLTTLLLSLLLNSCGSSSKGEKDGQAHFGQQEKEFIHTLFLTEYLWADQVASNIDYSAFSSSQSLVNELRVTPPDKWSFSITEQAYEDFVNQKTEGFGFGYTPEFSIFFVRIGAPAYGKLFRGDKILEINGNPASKANLTQARNIIGVPTRFTVLRESKEVEIDIIPQAYTFKVSLGKIITQNSKKIGYLRYDSFTGTSVTEFEKAFTTFKNENIDELVIDLRYNGGGSIAVASTLLDNITNAYPGQKQGYLDWNNNYKHKNENFSFSTEIEPNDLNMKRVFFLVTKGSASASELVISALKPYLGETNVITIGTNTHGKNVGMSGKRYGSNYYFIINFFVKNNIGETTSFDGIPVTCPAPDDIRHIMGDTNETMLSTALYYIQNNTCP
jgi:hypothetical protein